MTRNTPKELLGREKAETFFELCERVIALEEQVARMASWFPHAAEDPAVTAERAFQRRVDAVWGNMAASTQHRPESREAVEKGLRNLEASDERHPD